MISPCALSELGVVDPRTGVRHANDRYFALEGPPPDTPRRAAYNRDGGIAGMERYRALAELMRSDLVPSNELARHTADAGIRSKQELNSIHDIARRLQTPIRGPDSAEAVRSLDAIVDDTPASDLLTAAARNVDASSQMLTDPVSRAQILGLNWEDARVAANVVHAATDRDGSDGQGGTAAQAQAALDVIREVGGDRDGYLDRMADPVQDAVIGVGVGNFDALAASPVATSGVVGDPAARPDDPRAEPRADPRGRPLPPGIELTTAERDHYLQFVAGTDRSDTFHTQAMVWSQPMITDVLHGGDTRQLTDALGRAGRLDGAIAQAGFDYAWDQTAEQDRRNLDVARREARGNQGTATAVTSSAMIVVQAVMLV